MCIPVPHSAPAPSPEVWTLETQFPPVPVGFQDTTHTSFKMGRPLPEPSPCTQSPTHAHMRGQRASIPVRDLHSPTKPHPCPHSEMPGALKGPRWPRWEHCPGHQSFPMKPSRLSRPRDILTCGWGMHTCTHTSPGSVARSRGCASTVHQGGRQRRSTRPAALTVRRAPQSGQWWSPAHGAGCGLRAVYYTWKTGAPESS